MTKFIVLICAAFGLAHQANAADLGKSPSNPGIEDDERVFGAMAIAPVQLDTSLAGFDLTLETSIVREAHASSSTLDSMQPGFSADPRAARLTDMRLSARKSLPVTKNLMVDMLFRAEVATGDVFTGLGRGRNELMADLGLRAEFKPLSLWAGGARRFSKATRWSPGRDVNELYGGWNMHVGKTSELRMDFVSTGKRSSTSFREWSIACEYSKTVGIGKRIALYAGKNVGPWGNDINTGVAVRFKF